MSTYQYNGTIYTLPEIRTLFSHVSLPAEPREEDLDLLEVTIIPDPEPTAAELLTEARAERMSVLAEAFEKAQQEGHFASSLGFEVDATERAKRDVDGLILILEATGQTGAAYCDYGNAMHRVTLDQLKKLQLEIIMYGQMLYARKWELREAICAAETPEAVRNLEVSFDDLPAPAVPERA